MTWHTVPLGDLVRPASGRAGKGTTLPVYSITKHRGFVLSEEYFHKQIFSRDLSDYKRLNTGQFAYATIHLDEGSVGIAPEPCVISPMYTVFDPDSRKVHPQFLLYFMKSSAALSQYPRFGKGTVHRRKSISLDSLKALEVPLPPLEEQLRIAAILDKADALRTKRISSSRLLNDVEDAIFQSMFAHASFSTVSAGDVMPTMRNGLSPSRVGKRVANVLTLSAVTQGSFDPTAAKYGTFKNEPPIEQRVSAADFLMCRGNGNLSLVGVGTFADEDRADLVFPDTVIAGRVDQSKISLPFLAAVWRQQSTRSQIEAVARTTNGTYKVNQQTLAGVTVPLPPLALQQEFADRVRLVSEQRRVAETSSRVMENLFASLQSRAFTGEL